MPAFQYAPSNPYSCILLEGFRKFPIDPYYELLSSFMIIIVVHDNNNMEKWAVSAMYQNYDSYVPKLCLLFPMHLILLG